MFKKIFGDYNERQLKKTKKTVNKINYIDLKNISDEELQKQTLLFKERLQKGETLNDILPEAFATVREASKRVLGMEHYDVQLIGGIVLHNGDISEMKTGEGKTLVGTLPAYLNSLTGKGVHVITANEYLAKRDQEELEPLFSFLGVTTALNHKDLNREEKQLAYQADITFGTNNEFAFDYLRDNMVRDISEKVQRELNYVIIDEVDSILIDESRTPLIITRPAEAPSQIYKNSNALMAFLKKKVDYETDEKLTNVFLTDTGAHKTEQFFGINNLYDPKYSDILHYTNQSLRAHVLMHKNKDYVLTPNGVEIIDQFTGRVAKGRRFSNGLHQAIEAKENVEIQPESQTQASITFQNYFRLYNKISGMTGTALTEKEEFLQIYNANVIVIPTNKTIIREDKSDVVFKTFKEKTKAIVEEVKKRHENGQPVLIGTPTIEESEYLSEVFEKEKIPHNVLNAKHHEREAEIIKDAGQKNAITIATNMAGRGTDIKLGEGVKELGGLVIIGTAKHESRRIDNQLRGRAGRQGDPGFSQFFVSLEDELIVRFGGEKIKILMERLGFEEGEAIESSLLTKAFTNAQRQVEGMNYDSRKNLLKYDDVLREQRELVYKQRNKILEMANYEETIQNLFKKSIEEVIQESTPKYLIPEEWDKEAIIRDVKNLTTYEELTENHIDKLDREEIIEKVLEESLQTYNEFKTIFAEEEIQFLFKNVLLDMLDRLWISHIDYLTDLRQGIHLQAYSQTDPLREYQKIAFDGFQTMLSEFSKSVTQTLLYTMKVNLKRIQEANNQANVVSSEQ